MRFGDGRIVEERANPQRRRRASSRGELDAPLVRALDRKLLRDLWHLRGQVVAIALVVASGVACS